MTGGKKRGRPWKGAVFKDGSPLKGRGLSSLGVAIRIGQQEFFADLRKEFRAGPHVNIDLILDVVKYADGEPRDDGARTLAESAMAEAKAKAHAQSCIGGNARSVQNSEVKRAAICEHSDLFGKVRDGKYSANSAAQFLRKRLQRREKDGWIPSVRTLNEWFKEYRRV